MLVSAVVDVEAAVKCALGKWKVPDGITRKLVAGGAHALPITAEHAEALRHLPLHHRDPFDRLLVAQAAEEKLTLLTVDATLKRYGRFVRQV